MRAHRVIAALLLSAGLAGSAGAQSVSLYSYPNCAPGQTADAATKTCIAPGSQAQQQEECVGADAAGQGQGQGDGALTWNSPAQPSPTATYKPKSGGKYVGYDAAYMRNQYGCPARGTTVRTVTKPQGVSR